MTGRNAKIFSLLTTPEKVSANCAVTSTDKATILSKPLISIKPQRFPHMRCIGFCGLDDAAVELEEVIRLTRRCPRIEWGLLCHPDKAGQPRYPSEAFVMRLVNDGNLPLAAHLCGRYAADVFCGRFDFIRRLCGVRRIQLNINSANALVVDPRGACIAFATFPSIEWIIQYNDDTALLWTRVLGMGPFANVSVLHDRSCGKGEYTGDFAVPSHGVSVGYAGGLGPETVEHACSTLDERGVPFWIDMESAIRTNDELDLSKCRRCLDALGI